MSCQSKDDKLNSAEDKRISANDKFISAIDKDKPDESLLLSAF